MAAIVSLITLPFWFSFPSPMVTKSASRSASEEIIFSPLSIPELSVEELALYELLELEPKLPRPLSEVLFKPSLTNDDIRKPMVEKQRRERMNNSISQLKSLIASTIKQNMAPMTRFDKADILELTVFHLTQLQQQQRSVTMATEVAAYNAGFKDCAREAVTYLSNVRSESDTTISCLSNHLHTSYTMRSRSQDASVSVTTSQPQTNQRFGPQLSTPLRQFENSGTVLPTMNMSEYSPIPAPSDITNIPELTSSFVTNGLSFSPSSDLSSFGSSWNSSCSTNSFLETSGKYSGNMISSDPYLDIDVVTIGDGKENHIGHVIKENIWRPF